MILPNCVPVLGGILQSLWRLGRYFRSPQNSENAGLGGNFAVGFGTALHAGLVGGKLRIGGEISVAENFFDKHAPFAVVLNTDKDLGAVPRRECPVRRDGGMRQPDPLRRFARPPKPISSYAKPAWRISPAWEMPKPRP